MLYTLLFAVFGYLAGSMLFANISAALYKKEIILASSDNNPGTANAFMYGGFWCGMTTLAGDLLKGFVPIYMYLRVMDGAYGPGFFIVLSAPVIGHLLPLFYHFKGGKGIATTFGCLLGLFPDMRAAAALAVPFIFFSVIIRITSHLYRTIAAYISALIIMIMAHVPIQAVAGFFVILAAVTVKLINSNEEKERFRIRFLWMR